MSLNDLTEKKIIQSIIKCQTHFLNLKSLEDICNAIIEELKILTNSEYGFVGEYIKDNPPKFKFLTVCNDFTWPKMQQFYDKHYKTYITNINKNSLTGQPFYKKKIIISNDVPGKLEKDQNKSFKKIEHPFIKNFIAIPLWIKGELIGQISLANCPNGYSEELARKLEPLIVSCSNIIRAYKNEVKIKQQEIDTIKAQNKAKDQFLANMSHEIRTPLNGIIGTLAILEDTRLTSEQSELVEIGLKSSYSLMQIVNDILDVSKLTAGKMKLNKSPMNLRECVESAYDVLTTESQAKGLEFLYQIQNDVPTYVIQDFQRLKQILINLLNNAIKFTSKGQIFTSVEVVKTKNLITSAKTKKERNTAKINGIIGDPTKLYYIKFSVKDTGIGIKKEDQKKLFKTFCQLDSTNTKKYQGTGLGLAICTKFCKLMNGKIGVKSKYGKGSTFYFTIPVKVHIPKYAKQKIDLSILKGKRILVVDDNPNNLVIICGFLDKWEIEHRECTSAKLALAAYINNKKYQFDACLIDMCMPIMGGNELAKKIRNQGYKFPLIALSSLGEKKDVNSRFCHHLTKPIKEKLLQTTLLNIFNTDSSSESDNSGSSSNTESFKVSSGEEKFQKPINKNLKILVAEDQFFNQQVLLSMLKRIGYKNIDMVSNGEIAVKKIKQSLKCKKDQYNLILMDIKMPIKDGITATKDINKLYQQAKKERPPIIAITASVLNNQKDKYITECQFSDYITKPITNIDIISRAINSC